MSAPLPLLRSWLTEERRLLPERSQLLRVAVGSLLLFAVLLALEGRRRSDWIQTFQQGQRLERMELVSAALDDIRRTAFDWGRWNDSYRFITGRNPSFVSRDLAKTSLFSSGGVMVLFDQRGRSRVSYGSPGANRPAHAALVRCAQGALGGLIDLNSAIQLLCRRGDGKSYLGVLTQISTNDSSAAPVGSLVMFEPLIPQASGPRLRAQLQRFEAQLVLRSSPGSEDLPGGTQLLGENRQLIGLRHQSTLPLVWQSLRDDGLLALALLAPLLLARIRLTLAHRRQRLLSLRQERRATGRIRRVCRQLDQLLAELGLGAEQGSAPQRVMAELVGAADLAATDATDPMALEGRLHTFAQRFQRFLDGARSLALLDPLTQLPNRRFFVEQLALQVRSTAGAQARFALLFVDIDRFKEINDSFGHTIGDRVLIAVASRLRQLIDSRDFLARHGGDEFVILHELPPLSAAQPAHAREASLRYAERIAAAFEGPLSLDQQAIELSLSLGITLVQPDLPHPEVAIQQCDMAMLQAKRNKHTRIAIFDLDRTDPRDSDYELYSALRQAIRNNQLSVVFQPIVDATGVLRGVEALARWRHPQRGSIPPDLFVSLAERHRQMHRLGEELLRQALLGFRAIDPATGGVLGLSINLSPSQLEDPSLVNRILHHLELHHFPPQRLTLELTERGILEASAVVSANLSLLREHGIRLSLDDFGTGQSSLSLLSQLRPDEVKIDRSFVEAIDHDPYALQIVSLLGQMGPALGFQLVAEGVEEEATLRRLQRLGIDRFQGFWFSRPIEAPVPPRRSVRPWPVAE